ncbi:hypothetical protein AX17_005625, partial [Amanita inopinata Kibby_2008]
GKHRPFSDISVASLADAHINTTPGTVTLEDTKKRLGNILRVVSTENEAGCRLIINELLLHAAWNLDTEESGVAIAPEFRVGNTALDYCSTEDVVVESTQLAFLNKDIYETVSCNIYEAKPGGTLLSALPQAAMAVAVRAQELGLSEKLHQHQAQHNPAALPSQVSTSTETPEQEIYRYRKQRGVNLESRTLGSWFVQECWICDSTAAPLHQPKATSTSPTEPTPKDSGVSLGPMDPRERLAVDITARV